MICYNLIFSKDGQSKNIGSYIILSIIFLLTISMIYYCISGNKQLNDFVQLIIRQNFINKNNSSNNLLSIKKMNENKATINNKENKKLSFKKTKNKNLNITKKLKRNKDNANNIIKNEKKTNYPPRRNKEKHKQSNQISKSNISLVNGYKLESPNILLKNKNIRNNKKERSYNNRRIVNIFNYSNNIHIYNNDNKNISKIKKYQKKINENGIESLNDGEMNSLEYHKALIYDKRTYFQYYFSLLKKRHLILFTFLPSNDYNLFILKISLFLLSFSLFFTINSFFFNDNTMHKITVDNGKFDIIFQIPQILYSSIISSIFNKILKILSLSESHILSIKKEKNLKNASKKSEEVLKCLKIKFILFFILSFLLSFICWYFISGFCAVYKNTQIALIENTIISFVLSMLYPFGLNLIPGIFRIPSLRDPKKDKKCLYEVSMIISMI